MEGLSNWAPWLPLIGAVIGSAASLIGVAAGQGLTYWREKKFRGRKEEKDRSYLVALVAGALERFSEGCQEVAFDRGSYDQEGFLRTTKPTPLLELYNLDVEWKVLPSSLMFEVLDLPYRVEASERIIEGASEYAAMPPDFEEFFEQRQYQYVILGVDAARLAARLRAHAGVCPRSENPHWDSVAQMKAVAVALEARWKGRAEVPVAFPE